MRGPWFEVHPLLNLGSLLGGLGNLGRSGEAWERARYLPRGERGREKRQMEVEKVQVRNESKGKLNVESQKRSGCG